MAPRKRPETQKTPEVVVRPKSKRNRSPREPEPEAKKLCVKGPGTACASALINSAVGVLPQKAGVGGGCAEVLRLAQVVGASGYAFCLQVL